MLKIWFKNYLHIYTHVCMILYNFTLISFYCIQSTCMYFKKYRLCFIIFFILSILWISSCWYVIFIITRANKNCASHVSQSTLLQAGVIMETKSHTFVKTELWIKWLSCQRIRPPVSVHVATHGVMGSNSILWIDTLVK